jgi:hypothetical protein
VRISGNFGYIYWGVRNFAWNQKIAYSDYSVIRSCERELTQGRNGIIDLKKPQPDKVNLGLAAHFQHHLLARRHGHFTLQIAGGGIGATTTD